MFESWIKKVVLVAVVISLVNVAFAFSAQKTSNFYTDYKGIFKVLNGRYWTAISYEDKLQYLDGFKDGIAFADMQVVYYQKVSGDITAQQALDIVSSIEGFSVGVLLDELVKHINNFYVDKRNLNIPIVEAFQISGTIAQGKMSPSLLKEQMDYLRDMY